MPSFEGLQYKDPNLWRAQWNGPGQSAITVEEEEVLVQAAQNHRLKAPSDNGNSYLDASELMAAAVDVVEAKRRSYADGLLGHFENTSGEDRVVMLTGGYAWDPSTERMPIRTEQLPKRARETVAELTSRPYATKVGSNIGAPFEFAVDKVEAVKVEGVIIGYRVELGALDANAPNGKVQAQIPFDKTGEHADGIRGIGCNIEAVAQPSFRPHERG